jgi:type IV pilus assembly protein PilQ
VRVGTNVITNVTVTETQNAGTQCELELSTAGLVLGARIEKIDDNGFVTFSLSPSISAVTDEIPGPLPVPPESASLVCAGSTLGQPGCAMVRP